MFTVAEFWFRFLFWFSTITIWLLRAKISYWLGTRSIVHACDFMQITVKFCSIIHFCFSPEWSFQKSMTDSHWFSFFQRGWCFACSFILPVGTFYKLLLQGLRNSSQTHFQNNPHRIFTFLYLSTINVLRSFI